MIQEGKYAEDRATNEARLTVAEDVTAYGRAVTVVRVCDP